mmetsp:Transcript_34533/g.65723  ORF Transcript_34533/g.65723 Transcript_34533/m.65723 type:complete len:104 (+) Transcript_34533:765-1076(+)
MMRLSIYTIRRVVVQRGEEYSEERERLLRDLMLKRRRWLCSDGFFSRCNGDGEWRWNESDLDDDRIGPAPIARTPDSRRNTTTRKEGRDFFWPAVLKTVAKMD